MRSRLVVGNWKMHGSLSENTGLLRCVADSAAVAAVAVCVPFPYLAQAHAALGGGRAKWGAQDVSPHARGAFTGEVSAAMLGDFGCEYVIVGHSERRQWHREDDGLVAKKAAAVRAAGMVPILCVGETLAEREQGLTEAVVARQFDACAGVLGAEGLRGSVIAYEPVWAIGTGRNATPEQAQAVHLFLRARLATHGADKVTRVLYGGSVKAANAAELFRMPDVDGGLVGGASLVASEWEAICRAAEN